MSVSVGTSVSVSVSVGANRIEIGARDSTRLILNLGVGRNIHITPSESENLSERGKLKTRKQDVPALDLLHPLFLLSLFLFLLDQHQHQRLHLHQHFRPLLRVRA